MIRVKILAVLAAFFASTLFIQPADAGTFSVFEDGTPTLLGNFDAPDAGGAITSGSFSLAGGVFDTLGVGTMAPTYDAGNSWIVGTGSSFGSFANSIAFATTDLFTNPITCQIGECILSFTNSGGGGVPPEWYLDYIPPVIANAAPIDFGYYEIKTNEIPLPAAAYLLIGALGALITLRRRQSAA
ncbi:MAG: VPLPA-CTERM sorting domain-containing protein [Boseongicola sp.]